MIGIVVESVDVDEILLTIGERERLLLTYREQLELWQENRRQFRLDSSPNDPWSLHFLREASANVAYYRRCIDALTDEVEDLERELASQTVLLLLG